MTSSIATAPSSDRDEVSLHRLRGAPSDFDVEVRDEEVLIHGHRVRYLMAGDSGPTILLLHGLAGDADTYMSILPTLAKSCRVIAPDLLGHRLSAKPGLPPIPITEGGLSIRTAAPAGRVGDGQVRCLARLTL